MAEIKAAMPNAILIGYHGDFVGSSRDPFMFAEMDQLMGSLGLRTSFPSGVVDRVSGVQGRGVWSSLMNSRYSVPATVAIDVDRSFNKDTREFTATIDFKALTDLSGQYKFNVLLLEDGIIWTQSGNGSSHPHAGLEGPVKGLWRCDGVTHLCRQARGGL